MMTDHIARSPRVNAHLATWTVLIALLVACQPSTELPGPPDPLEAIPVAETLGVTGKAIPLSKPLNLSGTFEISAHVDQFAASGPPLRLRVQARVKAAPDGAFTMEKLDIAPPRLAKLLNLPMSGPVATPRWPLTVLHTLHAASALAPWLGSARSVGRCQALSAKAAGLTVEEQPTRDGRVIVYRTAPTEGAHRGEAAGYLALDRENRAKEGRVVLRKWTRFDSEGCRMIQIERVEIRPQ